MALAVIVISMAITAGSVRWRSPARLRHLVSFVTLWHNNDFAINRKLIFKVLSAKKKLYCTLWNCYWNSYLSLLRHLPIPEATSWAQPCVHPLQARGVCQQRWWTWHLYLGLLRWPPQPVSTRPRVTHLLFKLEIVWAACVTKPRQIPHGHFQWKAWHPLQHPEQIQWQVPSQCRHRLKLSEHAWCSPQCAQEHPTGREWQSLQKLLEPLVEGAPGKSLPEECQ